MANVLYISHTGMTEPLGRSQVLEYLIDLSKNHNIYLISFERESDLGDLNEIKEMVDKNNIIWKYIIYSNKYGIFSTVNQIVKTVYICSRYIKKHSIDIVHARSMVPATMGLILKLHGIQLLFDIRGFAIDEKVDSGRLKKKSILYKFLKRLDNKLYKVSDHIVALTRSAKKILIENLDITDDKITVIPTCANKKLFKNLGLKQKNDFRKALGYKKFDNIIIHVGTVSGWYDYDSELILVKKLMMLDTSIHYLILNKNEVPFIKNKLEKYDLQNSRVQILSSAFEDVHKYLNIAKASIFIIKETFSKQASAPTKFAENVACHLPSITNINIGDMGFYLSNYNVGFKINLESLKNNPTSTSKKVFEYLSEVSNHKNDYDELFNMYFDKIVAVEKYHGIYQKLLNKK